VTAKLIVAAGIASAVVALGGAGRGQEPSAPQTVSATELREAIDNLGRLDYEIRVNASRTVRRAPPAQAVPALLQAVSDHADGYVRYRSLVLLTGFNDPRERDAMRESLDSPNDRLRAVAYSYFEHHPDPAMASQLMGKLDTELAEFVRPSLVRALAALGAAHDLPDVRSALVREVGRGEDFFRSVVIEALGDYEAAYAVDALSAVAELDGPLQDDAALALGKTGDERALAVLARLQRSAPRERQPAIAAAICRLGVNCDTHQRYLVETLVFADENPGYQELLRNAAAGLATLGIANRQGAVDALFNVGIPSRDPTRAPVALALGTVALRNTPLMVSVLEARGDQAEAVSLLAEGFDMLEEDLEKERFFAFVRRGYWEAGATPARRALMQTLITQLDF
jgi:HEAT repeat protein